MTSGSHYEDDIQFAYEMAEYALTRAVNSGRIRLGKYSDNKDARALAREIADGVIRAMGGAENFEDITESSFVTVEKGRANVQ